MSRFLQSFIWSLLFFPFLVFLISLGRFELPDFATYAPVLLRSSWQASLSAFFSLFFGSCGALGLLSFSRQTVYFRFLQALLFLPGVLPVLFVLVGVLNIIKPFPYGLWGVVFFHVLINSGIVAVFLSRSMSEKLGGWAELAQIEGASLWQFIGASHKAMRLDLLMMFLFVFSLSFVSFAIPLIVGAGEAVSLELYIFDLIRRQGAWGPALWLSLLQSVVLFEFIRWIQRRWPSASLQSYRFQWPGIKYLILPGLVGALLVLVGFAWGLIKGYSGFSYSYPELAADIWLAGLGTLVVGLLSGISSLILMLSLAYVYPARKLQIALLGYSAPSSVLVGFAILIAFQPESLVAEFMAMIFGITLISLPFCYRLVGESSLVQLASQLEVAQSLGAARWDTFKSIVFPQVIRAFCAGSGLVAFWACGDFALSKIVASSQQTLGLLIDSLNLGYRLDVATYLCLLIIICGGLIYSFFRGVGIVLSRKSYL